MKIVTYFYNQPLTKIESYREFISEEEWNNKCQNISYIRIFGSKMLVDISKKRRNKSNYQHIWKEILIGFSNNTIKHY